VGWPKHSSFSVTKFGVSGWWGYSLMTAWKRNTVILVKVLILPILARLAWKRLQVGTDILLMIRTTVDELLKDINIDDIKRPWAPKVRGHILFICGLLGYLTKSGDAQTYCLCLYKCFAILGCDTHFRRELRQNHETARVDQDNLRM